jgi:long-subunit fatty acid transport protein
MNQRTGRASWRGISLLLGVATLSAMPGTAHAGGFEEPGIGVEAMGRGGAFTAKADDGSALEYNIAGFAQQRGTRLTIEGRFSLPNISFQRAGNYPGTASASQPYNGMPYPTVHDTNKVSAAPLLAISSDFGYFERWTFAVGLTTPSASDANRSFPKTVNGAPGPARYDLQNADLTVAYPMLAAAVRVTHWLDFGGAVQMVYGKFDLSSSGSADLGPKLCGTAGQNPDCDLGLKIRTAGFTATGVFGAMAHPIRGLHLGVNLRGPIKIPGSGNVVATAPAAFPLTFDPGSASNPAPATLPFHLPWVLRFGIRYAFLDKNNFEDGDIEIDGDYETWHQAEGGAGDLLSIPSLGPYSNLDIRIVHHYKDTGSVRIGGAKNFLFSNRSVLAVRGGFFYDSSATSNQWTRVDFDTMAKIGFTLGLGYKIRGVKINIAYNYIASPERIVTAGHQQILNGLTGTPSQNNGDPTPVFNDGTYHASAQVLLIGLGFDFDEILKKKRVLTYN